LRSPFHPSRPLPLNLIPTSCNGEIRQSEFAPVCVWGDLRDPLEQTSEERRILIAEGPTDIANGRIGSLLEAGPSPIFLKKTPLHIPYNDLLKELVVSV
jgi:hypothetical protein